MARKKVSAMAVPSLVSNMRVAILQRTGFEHMGIFTLCTGVSEPGTLLLRGGDVPEPASASDGKS